ncbi:MAG: DUF2318 domain-containing protein [Candidatus Thermoplasmatota archaeon]|jgi:uncharacterized membrane protein|nr:DUF2318 domain-containing protein [Candidatus Thermoplasmatota archaeon]
MPQKKQQKLDRCPECGCAIKTKNLDKHIRMVHEIGSQGSGGGGAIRPNKAEERKKLELEQKKMKMNIVFSVILISLVAVVIYFAWGQGVDTDNPSTTYEESTDVEPTATGEDVKILESEVTTNPKFYSYNVGGVTVRYFAVRGSDGNVHVAFDACDICYDAKKGYEKSGSSMSCKNCGKKYSINSLGTENQEGGCWPSYLPIREEGGFLYIDTDDLKAKKYMF